MAVINNLDRYRLALDVIERVPRLHEQRHTAQARYWAMMEKHKLYLIEHGEDLPEVLNWQWTRPARGYLFFQYFCISRNRNDAVHVISTRPVSACRPVRNLMWPMGVISPKPMVV